MPSHASPSALAPIPMRRFLLCLGALGLALALAGCGRSEPQPAATAPAPAPQPPAPATVVYQVGSDAVYPPFEMQDEKGQIVGFDIDIVKAVAEKAGIQVQFVNTPWEGMFNTLAQGDRDILASAITITDERRQTMDFSDAYFDAYQLIAVPNGSKVMRFEDLKTLRVGVQTATTGDEAASKLLGKTNPHLKRFESTPLALKELESGGLDAVVADNGVVSHYVANNGSARFKQVSDPAFVPEQYGLAIKKGNAELLAKLNQGLAALRADGSYDRIYAKHFGAAPSPR